MDLTRVIDKERTQRIWIEIRKVLMDQWDPIGVKNEPMAVDEYDMYIPGIHDLLKNGTSANAISGYLRKIEIERMGFAEFQVPNIWT